MERVERVNSLIKHEISQILLKEIEFPLDTLATITRVETSPNLIETKVWISVIPEEKGKAVLKILNKQVYEIQQRINKKLKMRPVPKIIFREDKQIVKASRVEELLEQIKEDSETVSE